MVYVTLGEKIRWQLNSGGLFLKTGGELGQLRQRNPSEPVTYFKNQAEMAFPITKIRKNRYSFVSMTLILYKIDGK